MNAFKQQCIALRKKDHTINEIMAITGRSKTSVYFHIKDIPLSQKKCQEISENTRQLALRVAASRKGKSLRPFKPFTRWTARHVLLISHLIFDGEIMNNHCRYHNRSRILTDRVTTLMKSVYAYPPTCHHNPKSGVTTVAFNNVALALYLKERADELIEIIPTSPRVHQREFVRAFFDDEGCMDYRPKENKRRIRGYQNDRTILILIKTLLANFGIESKLQGKNEVVITGKENLKRFEKEINFSSGVRLNPNRTNSLWKKDIEKRELLQQAIRSFTY